MEENRILCSSGGPAWTGCPPGRGHGWRWAWPAWPAPFCLASGLVFLPLLAIFPSHAQASEANRIWCDGYYNNHKYREKLEELGEQDEDHRVSTEERVL